MLAMPVPLTVLAARPWTLSLVASHPVTDASEPRLSFAIPYHRGRDLVREAIDSVRAQTVRDWELVIVDDAGPEPIDALVASYADPRIRHIRHRENLGLVGNWNACVELTRAPLVTLLHQDDRLLPEYAARVLAAAAASPGSAAYFTDVRVIGDDGRPGGALADTVKRWIPRPRHSGELRGDRELARLLAGNYLYCPTLCLRRERLPEPAFDPRWGFVPDWALTTGLLLRGEGLYALREVLFEYRRHGASQTAVLTETAQRFHEEVAFLEEMRAAAASAGWRRSEAAARRRIMTRVHLAVTAAGHAVGGDRALARGEWTLLRDDLRGGRHGDDRP